MSEKEEEQARVRRRHDDGVGVAQPGKSGIGIFAAAGTRDVKDSALSGFSYITGRLAWYLEYLSV